MSDKLQDNQASQDDNGAMQAEAKRRLARRRFLTGGVGAGAAIATLGGKRAYAFSLLTCLSLGGDPKGSVKDTKGLSYVECDL